MSVSQEHQLQELAEGKPCYVKNMAIMFTVYMYVPAVVTTSPATHSYRAYRLSYRNFHWGPRVDWGYVPRKVTKFRCSEVATSSFWSPKGRKLATNKLLSIKQISILKILGERGWGGWGWELITSGGLLGGWSHVLLRLLLWGCRSRSETLLYHWLSMHRHGRIGLQWSYLLVKHWSGRGGILADSWAGGG